MKIKKYVPASWIIAIITVALATSCDSKNPQLGKASLDKTIEAMTLEEKVSIVVGIGADGEGTSASDTTHGIAGATQKIARLGIPAIVLTDGHAGAKKLPIHQDDTVTYLFTAFPIGTLLASTWNTELIGSVGAAKGREALEYGADILLSPALNIHRNSLNSHNSEYYSEDPLVSGKMAAAMINGIQSVGVGASIKHLAVNNREINQTSSDNRLTQRALREIYLKSFEIGIAESDPWTAMSAYNRINGVYASEDRDLLTKILRYEWSYSGLVISDWLGGQNPSNMIYAGNDLLIPGLTSQKEAIITAVKDGTLSQADLNISVKRILEMVLKSPRFKGYQHSGKPDQNAHAPISRQSATEGMVLLKNDNQTLPITPSVKKIAAYGIASYDFISGSNGSNIYTVSLKEGLEGAGYTLNQELCTIYERYLEEARTIEAGGPKDPPAYNTAQLRTEEIVPSSSQLNSQAETADIALITIGRTSGKYPEKKISGDFNLTEEEQNLISLVSNAFHKKNKRVVVILNVDGVVETASWRGKPDAILLAWQAGQEGGNSVADILSGKVNPSGKLTMSFPVKYEDIPTASGTDYTNYTEDIFVGYRYFDTFKKPTSYPFGYGLSYTNFEYSDLSVKYNKNKFTINVTVKNTGDTKGKEVVQLYITAPVALDYVKPEKELKAFAKTRELAPNESQVLTMVVSEYDLASFSEADTAWVADAGEYLFLVGASSENILSRQTVILPELKEFPVNNVMNVKEPFELLKPR